MSMIEKDTEGFFKDLIDFNEKESGNTLTGNYELLQERHGVVFETTGPLSDFTVKDGTVVRMNNNMEDLGQEIPYDNYIVISIGVLSRLQRRTKDDIVGE